MNYLLALLLLLPLSVGAQTVDFDVKRHGCAPDGDPTEVQSTWLGDDSLELVAWDTESQTSEVVDGTASIDTSKPGSIRLFYATKYTPLPPDIPLLSCHSWVQLRFVIHGLKRAPYKISIEKAQGFRETAVGG